MPVLAFAHLLKAALNPSTELLPLPYTASLPEAGQARTFVSQLLRPIVCPEVPGVLQQQTMEIRFFAPGVLVSNLDFVESIFGNAGDPFLPENDARLDAGGWTGHTGCVIPAPHLTTLKKKIMAHGTWQGRSAGDPVFRALFNRETMLASEWYAARLEARAALDRRLWARHARDLRQFLNRRTRLQTSGREAMQSSLTAADRSRAGFSQPSRCCQSLSRHHWSGPFACSCGT